MGKTLKSVGGLNLVTLRNTNFVTRNQGMASILHTYFTGKASEETGEA